LPARPGSPARTVCGRHRADNGAGIPGKFGTECSTRFSRPRNPAKARDWVCPQLWPLSTTTMVSSCVKAKSAGGCLQIYLPANPPPATAEKPATTDSRLPRGHNKLVLVVDDEDPILDLVQKVLKRYGYRVLLAKNGVEAVELYTRRQKEVDVVITDMVMPIMDGPATITPCKPSIRTSGLSVPAALFQRTAKPSPKMPASSVSSPSLTRPKPC